MVFGESSERSRAENEEKESELKERERETTFGFLSGRKFP